MTDERLDALNTLLDQVRELFNDQPAGNTAANEVEILRVELRDLQARNATLQSEIAALRGYAAPTRPAPRIEAEPNPAAELIGAIRQLDLQGRKMRMGEILREAGVISEAQLSDGLEAQTLNKGKRLGDILVEKGYTGEDVIAQVLASQLGLAFARFDVEHVQEIAPHLLSARVARMHRCMPIRVTDEEVFLAMDNPLDLIAVDDVELTLDRRVNVVVMTRTDINDALEHYYGVESGAWF